MFTKRLSIYLPAYLSIYLTGENVLQQYKDGKLQAPQKKCDVAPTITKKQQHRKGHE